MIRSKRSTSRLAAIQALFQIITTSSDVITVIKEFEKYRFNNSYKVYEGISKDTSFFTLLVEGTHKNLENIDSYISKHLLEGWSISRMNPAMVSLLRTATFELIYLNEIPLSVVIDEYVTISSSFFNKNEVDFTNKILDSLAGSIRSDEISTL